MFTLSKNFLVISTSRLKISFRSSRPRLLGLSNGSGFRLPPTIDTLMLSGINAFVVSASRFRSIFSRSSVSGFDGSIKLSTSVGLLPQNDVSSRHLCGLGDLKKDFHIRKKSILSSHRRIMHSKPNLLRFLIYLIQ